MGGDGAHGAEDDVAPFGWFTAADAEVKREYGTRKEERVLTRKRLKAGRCFFGLSRQSDEMDGRLFVNDFGWQRRG